MSDPLGEIAEALADLSEAEVAAILSRLGARPAPEPVRAAAPRTPLPVGRPDRLSMTSEIEWV